MTWIIVKNAFLSAVAYDPANDRAKDSPFKGLTTSKHTHILVRGRTEEHLNDLKRVIPNVVIVAMNAADYRFRAVVKRDQWAKYVMLTTVDEVDYYSHFKEVVRAAHTKSAPDLAQPMYSAMMKVWGILNGLTPSRWDKGGKQDTFRKGETVDEFLARKNLKPRSKSTDVSKPPSLKPKPALDHDVLDEVETILSEMGDVLTADIDAPDEQGQTLEEMAGVLKEDLAGNDGRLTVTVDDVRDATDEGFELFLRVSEFLEDPDGKATAFDVDLYVAEIEAENTNVTEAKEAKQ